MRTGSLRITKREYYARGGMATPGLWRRQTKRGWRYFLMFW